ncbi:MAG: sulfate ABC transporter substrate-binding protein, partial [Marinovum sp.]|nr:sulfate ABC transporter substrate-binding protein [Marinovum sp.]
SLHTHVKYQLVEKLENWLTSTTAKSMINGYEIDGQALFTFNAEPK